MAAVRRVCYTTMQMENEYRTTKTRQSGRKRKKGRRKKRRSALPRILLTGVFILLVLGMLAGYFIWQRYSYGSKRADINNWFEAETPVDFPMILNGENIGTAARRLDGGYYLKLEDVHTYVSGRFYYGEADGELLYSTPTDIIRAPLNEQSAMSTDGTSFDMLAAIVRKDGDQVYVLMDYLALFYDITYDAYDAPNRMVVYLDSWTTDTATLNKKTHLRYRGGVKSDILIDLNKGDRVIILEGETDEWVKVRSADGFMGYVESKRLNAAESTTYGQDLLSEPVYSSISKPYTICLGWHQVFAVAGNDTFDEMTEHTKGMNTISPTWFFLTGNDGDITSFGTTDYSQKAHARGMEVWALVNNFENKDVDTAQVLARSASRKRLVDNLISEAKRCAVDGINVDFEEVPQEAGADYVQFLRELSIACRREQLVLSVDNYVPMGFNDYYDRKEQGVIADYVIIMGYDEHYGGSPEAGSVASIEYVRHGIEATCAQVPPEKVINAVPFYTRLWTTAGTDVSSQALGLPAAREAVSANGITLSWNAETEQYYGEVTNGNGALVQIWMEDPESINSKIAVMRANNIAGIAAWKLGLESPDVWDVIEQYVNGG